MYGVQPRPRKPGTITAVQVIMAVKTGLLLTVLGQLCLGLVIAALARGLGGIEIWPVATLVVVAPLAAVYLAVAVDVGRGREWARITAIVLESLMLAGAPFGIAGNDGYIRFLLIVGIAASIAVIGCATHRSAFLYCRTR